VKEIDLPDGSVGEFPDTMPDDQIQAVLRKQFGGAPAPTTAAPSPPSAGRRAFDAVAKPLTDYLGQGMEAATTPLVGVARMAHGEPASAAFGPETWQSVGQGGQAAQTRQQAAGVVVPQTPLQAGIMAGTMAAGPAAPILGPLAKYPALARVLGGTVGGAVGGAVEDPTLAGAGRGAAWGAGTTAAGELVGKVLGKLARSAPGAKGAIAAEDAANYAGEMGRQSPPLAGARTVQDLRQLAQGEGRAALGGAKEQTIQQIEALTGNGPLSVPALDANKNFTLREANDLLSEVGARAFSRNPLDRTFNGIDQRRLYGQIASELDAALGAAHPDAPGLFRQAQADYSRGLGLLRPLQAQNAYRLSPGDVQLNTPMVQTFLQNPKNAAALRNKLGDQGYQALLDTMTRGAGQGRDVLPAGSGGMLDAAMQSFGRGQNTGSAQFLGVPLRTLLPNVGAQYTGRQPLSLPPALQQALDVVLQRQAGQLGQP
jgi:hypothetical protein